MHPAFSEALRVRQGVRNMPEADRNRSMMLVTNDLDGEVALSLAHLHRTLNPVDAIIVAFLAGMIRERDKR